MLERDQVHAQDCVEGLGQLAPESVDLVFADPPFNIGYDYDVYQDRRGYQQYLDWSRQWMQAVTRVLKSNGTFWLAIGDEYAAELKLLAQNDCGLFCRSWVIWYYTFGVNCKAKFTRSHAHLFHFVKNRDSFTFNSDDPDVRIPSARQLVYADKRANPKGRLPDDTWIHEPVGVPARFAPKEQPQTPFVLRPQDIPSSFTPDSDMWYYSRVAGTFDQRQGWHGCQMPEQILGRIIRFSSHERDLVVDPFTGSGTTLAVAKKLNRQYLGFELSENYAEHARKRLAGIKVKDPLEGPADPLTSAPATSKGRKVNALGGDVKPSKPRRAGPKSSK